MFLWNILLALAWVMLSGEFTPERLLSGYVLGFLLLWLIQRTTGPTTYFTRVGRLAGFLGFYVWKLVLANLRLAYDVLTPRHHMRPGVVGVPLDAETDREITLLANLISLTPGTLSLDVSSDRRMLYLHAMYIDDVDALRREIKDGYERRVLELLR